MKEVISVTNNRRLDGPRRCTTQPPQLVGGMSEPFKPGYLELAPEVMERLLSNDNIEDYYEVEDMPFARGKYATVRRCRHRKTGHQYAAKYLKKRRRSTDLRYEILHEVAVLHACAQCPRIVNLYQVFETAHEMILILELAPGGELQMLLDKDEIPEERTVKRFMRQILDGLEFLHSVNVAHLDIKPQNLVLTSEFPGCDVKLCDFGISRYIGDNGDIREILGTPDYVAPEVLNYEAISLATDMWSVGVLLYVLLTGCSPFGGDTKQETFCNISQCRLDFPQELFEDISEEAKDLMKRLMVKESSLRLTATECLQHPWFQTTELPIPVPLKPTDTATSNISEILIRTPESARKNNDIKRQASIKRTPDLSRKTIECIRRTPETPRKPELFTKTPELVRKSLPESKIAITTSRKHSFNESLNDSNIKEKTRKLSTEKKPFENRRQSSLRDSTRRSSLENLVNNNHNNNNNSNTSNEKQSYDENMENITPKTNLKENLTNLAKKFTEEDFQNENIRKYQTLSKNSKFFDKEFDNTVKKALPSQTLPVHPIFHRHIDKATYKCKRIYIDDELGNNTAILIPVTSGQSSMSSISGGSSETSSITSDTVSEMSVDSSGDCSSFLSSDDSLDYVYKSVWDSGMKTGKVWIKECKGSFERALSRFNLEQNQEIRPPISRRYQKNNYGSLNRKSMYTSSPILNKIGHLANINNSDNKKYGVQLMKEGSGNVVVIREVKAGRYTKFSEVKCESVQSRIKKLQDQTGAS